MSGCLDGCIGGATHSAHASQPPAPPHSQPNCLILLLVGAQLVGPAGYNNQEKSEKPYLLFLLAEVSRIEENYQSEFEFERETNLLLGFCHEMKKATQILP